MGSSDGALLSNRDIEEMPRVNVLGVRISTTNMAGAVENILGWVRRGEKHYVCVTGVHGVMECQKDPALVAIHNASGLTVPDGMPMVWASWLHGFSQTGRVFGPDLMQAVCKMSIEPGYTSFLYGGADGVAPELKRCLESKLTGIRIIGTYTPPFRPLNRQEEGELIDQVGRLKPDIFWVGLSTPKQERFMAAYLPKLNTKVMLGVGAAFDFHTGRIQDAPHWIKKSGLQWLHRFIQDPRRLWKRNLIDSPTFVLKFLGQLLINDFKLRLP